MKREEFNWENEIFANAIRYLLDKGKKKAALVLTGSQIELVESSNGWNTEGRYLKEWHLYLHVPMQLKNIIDDKFEKDISMAYEEALGSEHYLRDLHVKIIKVQMDNNRQKEFEKKLESWDLFICYASEDKQWVKNLAKRLIIREWRVWFDEFELTIGDSLRRRIDYGLINSRFGVVILSKSFFNKEFPNRELDGLAAREIDGNKVILPIWHGVSYQDIVTYSPILADRLAISTSKGIEKVIDAIEKVLKSSDIH